MRGVRIFRRLGIHLLAFNSTLRHGRAEPVVITGIGMLASVGQDRESVWRAVRQGRSGVRPLLGLPGIPEGLLLGAPADVGPGLPRGSRVIAMCRQAAGEAIRDAEIDFRQLDRDRFGCAIGAHIGDTRFIEGRCGYDIESAAHDVPWWQQWLPNTACSTIAGELGLYGPRICHSTACASGLIEILSAARAIQDHQCDIALAGSGEAFHPLFAAGFHRMRVLAYDDEPQKACRPFDANRKGFVMGEGAGMFVIERLGHAQARGATIYAELAGGAMAAEAHHVTGLDTDGEALAYVIRRAMDKAGVGRREIDYINAHGTGTRQNDLTEVHGIRRALGPGAEQTCVSATKSMLGHLVNASGSVELAITTLALRDGFAPPTLNLTDQDPDCDLDCLPLIGRTRPLETALKLSVAFGGHLVAITLRRWKDTQSSTAVQPSRGAAA